MPAIEGIESSKEEADRLVYAVDASGMEGETRQVLWPKNTQEVQKAVLYAIENKIDLVPRGAGTDLAGAAVPENSIVLDLTRMNRILETGADYVIVEPGIVLDNLNRELGKKNLFLPVIPSSHSVCTIGGMISCNAAGVRAIKYGKMREWVTELEVVTGKGEMIKVAGPQIDDFCGTEGTIGIITKARLRLAKPLKEYTASIYKYGTPKELAGKTKEAIGNRNVIAVEYMDKLTNKLSGDEEAYYLFIEYEGCEGDIKDPAEIEKRMHNRNIIGQTLSSNGYIIIEDPKIPHEKIPDFLEYLSERRIPNFGHIGIGVIHARLKTDQDLEGFHEKVQSIGGEVSGEHGIGLTKRKYAPTETKNRIKELKQKYDPQNILNRGKIIDYETR
jgi:glycolate oxidase